MHVANGRYLSGIETMRKVVCEVKDEEALLKSEMTNLKPILPASPPFWHTFLHRREREIGQIATSPRGLETCASVKI
jgi:hypothetical protein